MSTGRLPRDVEASAYFIVAEALTNIIKHANATHAQITAAIDEHALSIEVRDDGVGGADPDGSGLVGIADRVEALGGHMSVESGDRSGTVVTARLPLSTSGRATEGTSSAREAAGAVGRALPRPYSQARAGVKPAA